MKKKHLSSRVTYVYKYFFPLIFIMLLFFLIISIFINYLNVELDVRIFLSVFSFIFCLFMIPLIKLHDVWYNDKYTILKGFKTRNKILNSNVLKVKRYMFYFYRLHYLYNGEIKKQLFLPHISGVFMHFGGKPKSVRKYELLLK